MNRAASEGNVKVLSLQVGGLDCASCAEKAEKALMRHNGVKSVTIYLSTRKIDIRFDPSVINEKSIISSITGLGFKIASEEKAPGQKTFLERLLTHEWSFELTRIGVVLLLLLLSYTALSERFFKIPFDLFSILAVLIGGYPLVRHAVADLREKAITADVFMSLGVIASTAIGEIRSAGIIAFFMLIAELLDSFTMERSRKAIKELIELAPKTARVKRGNYEVEVPVEEVRRGDVVVVKAGEKIPVEGIIISGRGSVNQAPITGESIPVEKREGDQVYAATINQLGILFIKVTHTGEDTTYARIIKLVEEAESSKAKVQRVADRFAAYFTPAILTIAVLVFIATRNITYSIAVLVVACPCTVAIATPLAMVASMGKAAKRGIIIKGGLHLESLAKVDTLVMDKTGTLTLGDPIVTEVKGFGCSNEKILAYAAGAERYSEHPLAKAILKKAVDMGIEAPDPDDYKVIPGKGIEAVIEGERIVLGSRELLRDKDIMITPEVEGYLETKEAEGNTVLLLAHKNVICGAISVADIIREGTIEAIDELKGLGFADPIMLTGDNPRTAQVIASTLGIKKFMAQLLPEDKVARVRELAAAGKYVLMIGDGINDAPALAQAHVGIAMGAVGSGAAIEASHVALMRDEWKQIPEAVRIGRNTFKVIKQNLTLGILFNVVGISLASVGILSPAMAAVAHVMPDVLVFLNSSRLLR
ncbi:MAG: cation-translocating P-type ATPase [Nitrospirota bacterium]